jgi:hypothetical protein
MKSTASLLLAGLAFVAVACGENNDKPVLDASTDTFTADQAAQEQDNAIFAVKTFADENGNVNDEMTQVAIVRGDFSSQEEAQAAVSQGAQWQPINQFSQDDEFRFMGTNEAAELLQTELITAARGDDRPMRNGDRQGRRGDGDRTRRPGDRDRGEHVAARRGGGRRGHHRFRRGHGHNHRHWRPYRHHRRWGRRYWRPRYRHFYYGPRRFRCGYNTIYWGGRCVVPVSPYYGGYNWGYRGGYNSHYNHGSYSNVTVRFYF